MSRRRLALAAALMLAACSPRRPVNVLLVTFDTTRADFLGCYGKASARTPNLDRLAAEGTLFLNAMTAIPITLPSHSTIFTGTYPIAHGVRDNSLFRLPDSRTTLAEILKARGHATGAAIGGFPLVRSSGIAQGFDFYDDHVTIALEDYKGDPVERPQQFFFDERPAPRVNDAILPWLRAHARSPFFAWVHYWDPHHPHIPPAPFNELYAQDLYQGEIAFADQSLGVLLDELKAQGVYDKTIIVISADHGEGRGEHNEDTHSMLAYNTTLHDPLIMRIPGEPAGRRVPTRVGTVDILPTVLDFLGIPVPAGVQGRSLRSVMRRSGPPQSDGTSYYAETLSPRLSYGWGEQRVLFEGPLKYIHGPRQELYDLSADPQELRNLAAERPADKERMERVLASFLAKNASASIGDAVHEVDPATRDRLAALGYLSAEGTAPATVKETLRTDGTPPQDRVRDVNQWTVVKESLTRGDFLTAKELGVQLVERDPDNPFYSGMLAMAYVGLGQLEAAAKLAESGHRIGGGNEGPFLEVARQLVLTQRKDRGVALARKIVEGHPSATGYFVLGEVYRQLGDRERKLAAFQEAVKLDADFSPARVALAVDLAERGQTAEAEREFKAVLATYPRHSVALLNYGTLLLKGGRFDEGVNQVRRALEINPSYWKAHLALLAVHVQQREVADAERVFRTIQEGCRDPDVLERARDMMARL
jgi:arylsulfatase A-like enzyme/Tfp pilus assembly protein PilF